MPKTNPEERAEAHRQKLRSRFEAPTVRRLWADRGARRRRLFLALCLVLLATAALIVLALSQDALMTVGSSFALLVVLLPLSVVSQRLEAGSRTSYGYEQVVDERQRAEIDEARNLGHSITSALLILTVAVAGAAHLLSAYPLAEHTVPIGVFLPVAWLVLVVHRFFPAAYLAWTQAAESPDDEGVPPT